MKTRLLCALGALILAPAVAAGQGPTGNVIRLSFAGVPSPDSVFAALPGTEFEVSIQGYDFNYYGSGVGAFTLRVHFDPGKLTFVSARSICPNAGTAPLNPPVTASSYVELSAPGCNTASLYYNTQGVVAVRFRLAPGAVDGTVLYVRPVSVNDGSGANRTLDAVGEIADVCVASGLWGDVDADGQVNSRDALIALTHAVGLPTPGFDLSRGDADGDGIVSSRDALGMLSASIGLPPTSGFRTGKMIVGRCAPQAVLPQPFFYDRVAYGNGLTLRPAGDSTIATVAGNSADATMYYRWRPRVSPDGSRVLFVCLSNGNYSGYPRICRANADGTGVAYATSSWSYFYDTSPDWSPDGTRIVFIRDGRPYTMLANGDSVAIVHSSFAGSSSFMTIAWQPVDGSTLVAYTTTSGEVRVGTLADSLLGTQTVVFSTGATPGTYDPSMIEWSPAGDSLAFDLRISNNRTVVVTGTQAAAPLQLRAPIFNTPYGLTYPLWTDLGTFFVVYCGGKYRIFLQKPDGTIWRVGRERAESGTGGVDNYAPGMQRVAP